MRLDAVNVVHDHPLVLTNAFPHIRGLATASFRINLLSVIIVEVIDAIADHIFDASRILLCHIGHEVTAIRHRTDIGIEHLDLVVGIIEQQLGLGL